MDALIPARTRAASSLAPPPAHRSTPGNSGTPAPKKDDKYRTPAALSGEVSQSRPPQSPHSQYPACPPAGTEAPGVPPEIQKPSPCRTASSPHAGCPPEQCSDETLSSEYPAKAAGSCAHRTSSSAHKDHNPTAPNQSPHPRLPLHCCVFPPPPPCSHD